MHSCKLPQKLFLYFFVITFAAINLFGCSSKVHTSSVTPTTPTSLTLIDGWGRTISLQQFAERVVSLAPANTEILFAIGAGKQVVGRDTFSDFPPEAQNVTDIGGGFGELNVETIIAQKPDLVITSDLTPPEQVKALEGLGLTVFVFADPKDFSEMFENIRLTARLTGHLDEAEAIIRAFEKRIETVQTKTNEVTNPPLVFYELDGTDPNAPWTPGPGSFVATLIQLAGGKNLGSILDHEWAQISIEELINQDPDIIVIGDATWGGVTVDDVRNRTGWQNMRAVRDGKLFTFDDNLVSRPGPRIVDGLEAMAKLLHPELFQ